MWQKTAHQICKLRMLRSITAALHGTGCCRGLREEKLTLQVAWKRAEGCAGEGRAGRTGGRTSRRACKTKAKGEKAFHRKTCKKAAKLWFLAAPSFIQLQVERCWVGAQTSTLQFSKPNSYGLVFFPISLVFSPCEEWLEPCRQHPSGYLPFPAPLIPLTFLGIISILPGL